MSDKANDNAADYVALAIKLFPVVIDYARTLQLQGVTPEMIETQLKDLLAFHAADFFKDPPPTLAGDP